MPDQPSYSSGSRLQTILAQPLGTKILLFALLIFGTGSLVYGAYSVQQRFVLPFRSGDVDTQKILAEIIPKTPEEDILASKTKDTDSDGLIDFDEVTVYATSPYLPDTDSDGTTDGSEVKNGTDPNCKPGDICGGIRLVTPDTKVSDLFPQFSTSNITLKDKTIQEFRQILLDQGFEKDNLDKISDSTLLIILEESLKAQDQAATTTPPISQPINQAEYDQIRLLLIELGVPKDEVYSLSNAEVEEILKTLK